MICGVMPMTTMMTPMQTARTDFVVLMMMTMMKTTMMRMNR